jgi:adenosylcobinamide kinase / adenosylcobinamide-phosphate guanylyltransferase
LVLGGIRSGKSEWAERALVDSVGPDQPLRYVATGPKDDADPSWSERIAAHQARRQGVWETVETDDVATVLRDGSGSGTATLVDDMGGWLLSESADIDELLDAISGFASPLVVVSPEVGLAVVPATESGRRFADEIGSLNQRLADICDRVVLVVAGQPVIVKGAHDR